MIAKMKVKLIISLALLNLCTLRNYSQNPYINQVIIPPTPTASSFQQFDLSQVNLYNGLPTVNIPIYELELGNFKFPISLNYNYDGFKVEDIAGWLGLGWNTNAGGMISHIVRGKPDDEVLGYDDVRNRLNIPDPIHDISGFNTFMASITTDSKRLLADGYWDCIPDDYTIKANNLFGSIIKLKNGEYVTIPFKPYKITKTPYTWEVRDENGNLYRFGQLDGVPANNGLERTFSNYTNGNFESFQNYLSNWFLKEIITNTGEEIHFNYSPETIERHPITNETIFKLLETATSDCPTLFQSIGETTFISTGTWKLNTIECRNCSINFYSTTLRKDIIPGTTSCSLDSIVIKDYAGQKVKKFVFDYNYLGNSANYDECRLILEKITEFGNDGVMKKPPYMFGYNSVPNVPL
jgi:hypothetical protein